MEEPKNNPDKKPGLLKRIDSYLTDKSIKIATKWENKVKRSKDDLATLCYATGMVGFGTSAIISKDIFASILSVYSGYRTFFYEGRPTDTMYSLQDIADPIFFIIGVSQIAIGLTNLISGIANNNNENLNLSLYSMISGFSFISYTNGEYVSKIKLENQVQDLYEKKKDL